MEFMEGCKENEFNLAVVDPPYGINAGKMTMGSGKHKFTKNKQWDSKPPTKDYFDLLFSVSNNQIIWGGNYFTDILPPSQHWLVWDKANPNLSFAEGELAWVRHGNNLRIFKHYSAQVEDNGKIHPTQKSVKLYRWIFKNYTKPTDHILDTHGGSMSSAIAAHMEGLRMTIIELDEEYFQKAIKRFETYEAQQTISFDL